MAKKLYYDADGNAYTKEQVDKMWAELPKDVRKAGEALIAQRGQQRQRQQQQQVARARNRRRSGEEIANKSLETFDSFFQTFYGKTYSELKAEGKKKKKKRR